MRPWVWSPGLYKLRMVMLVCQTQTFKDVCGQLGTHERDPVSKIRKMAEEKFTKRWFPSKGNGFPSLTTQLDPQNLNWNPDTAMEVFLWQYGRRELENLWKAHESASLEHQHCGRNKRDPLPKARWGLGGGVWMRWYVP